MAQAAAQAQYKLDIGTYDGTGGTLKAKSFIADVNAAVQASGMADARMAGVVRSALRGDARLWIETQDALGTVGLGLWTTMQPLLSAEFCGSLTVAELVTLEKQLEHKPLEKVAAFYIRCQRFHLEEDQDLPQATKDDDIYKEQFGRKVKFSFMKGLRQEVRLAMAGIDVQDATAAQLLAAAKSAEVLVIKKPAEQKADTDAKVKAQVDALTAGLSEDGRAILAVMEHRFFRGGRGGRGQGRGGARGQGRGGRGRGYQPPAQDGGGRRPGPSQETLRAREKALCGKCNQWVKHRANECFQYQNTDGAARGGGNQGNRGGGGGARGNRSYANAAGAHGPPESEFQVFDYEEPQGN
jgi:hypothetical protein